jgi:vacuolar-type H+-ATPase subunit E/Vma4
MDRTEEKLLVFSDTVLKEAARQKEAILQDAKKTRDDMIDSNELRLLQEAHDEIQEALRSMDRASNEEISRTILESKQALFTRRQEIVDAIFSRVEARLAAFRQTPAYRDFLRKRMMAGAQVLGGGQLEVMVDETDLSLARELATELDMNCEVMEAASPLHGGCQLVNRTTGRMDDDSFSRRLETERASFLERYELRLDG